MDEIPNQVITSVPARISVPASCTFQVFDCNNNLVAQNVSPTLNAKDVLLDSTARIGNGVDPSGGPWNVVFTAVVMPQPNHDDSFPEGV